MSDTLAPVLSAIAGLAERIGGLNERIGGLNERIGGLDERVGGLDERIGGLDNRMGRLEERSEGIRDEVTRLRVDVMERLDRHQDLLTSFKDDLNVNVASTDNVREKVKSVENDYHQLAHQLSVVHRRLMALESRFDARENGA